MSTPTQSFAPVAELPAVRRINSASPPLASSHAPGVSLSTVSTQHDRAVILTALCIQRLYPLARIGFFPADHHVVDEPEVELAVSLLARLRMTAL